MDIKSFEPGQQVYILKMYEGRTTEPQIISSKVEKVGRKYVTSVNGNRYEERKWFPFGLVQTSDYGDVSFLCPSETDAKMYIEQRALTVWLSRVNFYDREKYTLEQLRKIKRILEPDN